MALQEAIPAAASLILPTKTCPVRNIPGPFRERVVHEWFFEIPDMETPFPDEKVYLNVIAHETHAGGLALDVITLTFNAFVAIPCGWALLQGNRFHEPAILITNDGVALTPDAIHILKALPSKHRDIYAHLARHVTTAESVHDEHHWCNTLLDRREYASAWTYDNQVLSDLAVAEINRKVLGARNITGQTDLAFRTWLETRVTE